MGGGGERACVCYCACVCVRVRVHQQFLVFHWILIKNVSTKENVSNRSDVPAVIIQLILKNNNSNNKKAKSIYPDTKNTNTAQWERVCVCVLDGEESFHEPLSQPCYRCHTGSKNTQYNHWESVCVHACTYVLCIMCVHRCLSACVRMPD